MTGEMEPVESRTFPFRCMTEQYPLVELKTEEPFDRLATPDLPQYMMISCVELPVMVGIFTHTAAWPLMESHCSI